MKNTHNKPSVFDNTDLLKIIQKYYKQILAIIIITIVISVVFSGPYFITPKYKSSATIYPYNIIQFSSETASEQLMQFAYSDDIHEKVIEENNLAEHYAIDKNAKYFKTKLYDYYFDHVKIQKTEYESICIEVTDKNAEKAYVIVLSIIEKINKKIQQIQKKHFYEYVLEWEARLHEKEKELDSLRKISDTLRIKYNLWDYDIQLEKAAEYYYRSGSQQAKEALDNLKEKGEDLRTVNIKLQNEETRYAEIKKEYEEARDSYNKNLSYTSVVSSPKIADKKSYPVRWLIVLLSVFSATILSLIVLVIIEKQKTISE
jgi:uncharacterized protein involved in exopolysaccharide biosynthesis